MARRRHARAARNARRAAYHGEHWRGAAAIIILLAAIIGILVTFARL